MMRALVPTICEFYRQKASKQRGLVLMMMMCRWVMTLWSGRR